MSDWQTGDQVRAGTTILVWALVFAVFLTALSLIGVLLIRPLILSAEAQQNRASQQYQEAQESNLFKMDADYAQLEAEIAQADNPTIIQGKRAQQTAIRNRAQLECSKLRPDARPVLRFVSC